MLTRSLVALLLWVAGLLAPVAAHGPVPTLSENRVWAPAVENQTFTGADRLLSLELHRSNAPPTVRFASGDSVGPARAANRGVLTDRTALHLSGQQASPIHHIATNKNFISSVRGGPWSGRFQRLFDRAGLDMNDALNRVRIPGHAGPHPEAYHRAVLDRLTQAVQGTSGSAYRQALETELRSLARDVATPGNILNDLLRKVP